MNRNPWIAGQMLAMLLTVVLAGGALYGDDGRPPAKTGPDLISRLEKHVYALTGTSQPRSHAHVASLDAAAAYITAQFADIGLNPAEQKFKVDGKEYKNIIGRIDTESDMKIIVGAHYDVCGDQPGADDNASGVAGLIELARMLKAYEKELKADIEFVAYALEEPPYFSTLHMGSAVHARSILPEKDKVLYMMCLEMIGFFTESPNSQNYPLPWMRFVYPTIGDFIAVVGDLPSGEIVEEVRKSILDNTVIDCQTLVAPALTPGIDFSDHRNYWMQGFKAVMITDTAFFRNINYHTGRDTPETLHFDKMAEVIKGLVPVFLKG